jgi:superfamily II DNA or RNA helicase
MASQQTRSVSHQTSKASSPAWPRILAEHLADVEEPLGLLLVPGRRVTAREATLRVARLLTLGEHDTALALPGWLAPHQRRAAERLVRMIARHDGAVLADSAGLGKSWIALGVAAALGTPFTLVVPAVLVRQWRALLDRLNLAAEIVTHEELSRPTVRLPDRPSPFLIVDEAHRFRAPETRRYDRLARLAVGRRVLLVTATPVCNRPADLIHLVRIFTRDDALVAYGVPSLLRATRCDTVTDALVEALGHLVVARSRTQVEKETRTDAWTGGFPTRVPGTPIRMAPAPEGIVAAALHQLRRLNLPAADGAGSLLKLTLVKRLASSIPAFRATLRRHRDFIEQAMEAARAGRALTREEFQRLFPRDAGPDLQLALLPLLLQSVAPPGDDARWWDSLDRLDRLLDLPFGESDPKVDRLRALLRRSPQRTIVFVDSEVTATHLLRRLSDEFRVAAVTGRAGRIGAERVTRDQVLAAFAPIAQGAAPPREVARVDVLIATDLVSEGLNLQDASRVVHYDLPWSPARLAQRTGRIDRLGSTHREIAVVTFVPTDGLERALRAQWRLLEKLHAQRRLGVPDGEAPAGKLDTGALDWADTLARLDRPGRRVPSGPCIGAAVAERPAVVAVVSISHGEEKDFVALVIDDDGQPRSAPRQFVKLVERASTSGEAPPGNHEAALAEVVESIAPLVRARLAAVRDARWRSAEHHRPGRRLLPWVMASARRAARSGDAGRLAELDRLLARLASGLTAGEERGLNNLLDGGGSITLDQLIAWNRALPPMTQDVEPIAATLEVVLLLTPPCSTASSPT